MTRMFRAAALLLVISAGAGADEGENAPKTLGFFGKFAAEQNRNKFDGRLDCVYGDPVKGKMCPPVMEDPMAHLKSRESVSEGQGGTLERLAGGVYRFIYGDPEDEPEPEKKTAGAGEEESALSIFSRCLDDPDDPDCRELQVGNVSPSSQVASAPGHGRNLQLITSTLSPTTDDCGGNMFDPRFCASAMPSISAAPTEEGDSGDVPTNPRIVGTLEPTLCQDRKVSPFIKVDGGPKCPVLFDDSNLPIVVDGTTMDEVRLHMRQTFGSGVNLMALTYLDKEGNSTCLVVEKPELMGSSSLVDSMCDESGFIQIHAFAGSPDFQQGQAAMLPDSCAVSADFTEPAFLCQYRIAIPCACSEAEESAFEDLSPTQDPGFVPPGPDEGETGAPTQDPTVMPSASGTECETREQVVNAVVVEGEDSSSCSPDVVPFAFVSHTDKVAVISVNQTWGDSVEWVGAFYRDGSTAENHGEQVCVVDKDVPMSSALTYSIECEDGDWAYLDMYVHESEFGDDLATAVEVPPVCGVDMTTKTCHYRLTVTCRCSPGAPTQDPGFVPPGPDEGETATPSQDPGFVPPGPDEGETATPSQDPGFVPPGPDEGETAAPSQDPGFVPPGPDGGETAAPSQDPGFVPPGPDGGETAAPSQDPGFVPPGPDGGETAPPTQDPGAVPPGPDGGETAPPTQDPGAVPPGPDGGETAPPTQDPGAVPPGPDEDETASPTKEPALRPTGPDEGETASPTKEPALRPTGPDGGETASPTKEPALRPTGPDGGETASPTKEPALRPTGPDGGETASPTKEPAL
eukprot:scaffold44782_cov191-Amphora_coffeaeformis.AAC.1